MTVVSTMLSHTPAHIYSAATPTSKKLHVPSSSPSQHFQYHSRPQPDYSQQTLDPIVAPHPLLDEDIDLELHELDYYDDYLQQLQAQTQAPAFSQQSSAPSQLQSQSLSLPYYSYAPSSPAGAASSAYSSPIYSAQNSPTSDFCSYYRGDGDVSMSEGHFSPHIQLHQPTPPFGDQSSFGPETTSMLLQQGGVPSSINNYSQPDSGKLNHNGLNTVSQHQQRQPALHSRNSRHRKALSGSSGASGPSSGPLSPPDHPLSPFSPSRWNSHASSTPSSTSLPTPNQTPVLSFPADSFKSYDGSNQAKGFAMTHDMDQQDHDQQELGGDEPYPLAPPSMSTQSHDSPPTPHVPYSEGEDPLKSIPHDLGDQQSQMTVPKLDRTISDMFQDELYQPAQQHPTSQPQGTPGQRQGVATQSPYHNLMADRLRAAHQGHVSAQSHSPVAADNRQPSPFRQGSPYAHNAPSYQGPHLQQRSRLNQPFQMGGPQQPQTQPQQQPGMGGMGLMQGEQGQQETISPKEAMLDYNPSPTESNTQLFPSQSQQTPFTMAPTSGFQQTPGFSRMDQFPTPHGLPQAQNFGGYMQQPQPQQQFPLQQPSHASQRRTAADLINQTPQFPPPMPTMESTNSEGNAAGNMMSPTAQRQQQAASRPNQTVTRPTDTSSNGGTYSCTYRNCTRRFETQPELQRHKRDGHRGQAMTDPATGASLSAQNSQAGPHRCMRIDPATNKPCNVVFSRPYDLTRHEDTKHNAAKQKVRCHFCSEEKTFSRNDALTRHMRVVHPEIDWPGKQKPKRNK